MELSLTPEIASKFAQIALGHVGQEYPNQPQHAMESDTDAKTPRELHPAFFGSYDWHSCVHSWWLLLTLRRLFPTIPEAQAITELADATLTQEKLAAELAYFERPLSRGWERPYGWGWLLYLHHEAERHEDHDWARHLEPLAHLIAQRFSQHLPLLTYPITVGTHFNTAFALVLAREWAEVRDSELRGQIDAFATKAFGGKQAYAGWEPGGDEFLSPVLTAALLMSKVMPPEDFALWFDRLVVANRWLENECHPVSVSDRSDGKIAHLDGLNLSRAWCLRCIGQMLAASKPGFYGVTALIEERAEAHLKAAIQHVAGDYMGEHWLASFALLALLEAR